MSQKGDLVYGFGVNDADYAVYVTEKSSAGSGRRIKWYCPFYKTWNGMIERGYSEKLKEKYVSYRDVRVCEDWRYFSNFKDWMEKQDWKGKQLDKDLLVKGNKIYSPETCVFIEARVNSFITENRVNNGNFPVGVHYHQNKYVAVCGDPYEKAGKKYLGRFLYVEDAAEAWRAHKESVAIRLAEEQTDEKIIKALVERYKKESKDE